MKPDQDCIMDRMPRTRCPNDETGPTRHAAALPYPGRPSAMGRTELISWIERRVPELSRVGLLDYARDLDEMRRKLAAIVSGEPDGDS